MLIADEFERRGKDYTAVPAVLCKNHGPFTWGKDAHEAVHNAVVLEEVAKMAARCEMTQSAESAGAAGTAGTSITTANMGQMPTMDRGMLKNRICEKYSRYVMQQLQFSE